MSDDARREANLLAEFGLGDDDAAAWAASGLPAEAFDGWLTDRVARRPAGARARAVYGAEDVHDWARRAVLEALALGPGDRLLDIGCGGGLLLRDAMRSGAIATGIDHSPALAAVARERATGAAVVVGSADALPFPNRAFTAVSMVMVFFFFAEPLPILRECRRVLAPGGRVAIYTISEALRGTGAAPEPLASLSHFHTDAELVALATEAGFRDARVLGSGGDQLLTAIA
jgi:SAM-dependent methyltransferase